MPRFETLVADPPKTGYAATRILVVDDDPSVRMLVRICLEMNGFETMEADSGETALGLFLDSPDQIGLVVTDVRMPGMSGPQLSERLLAINPGLRVVFMSGMLDDETRAKWAAEDPLFLSKPFLPGDLLGVVRGILPPVAQAAA